MGGEGWIGWEWADQWGKRRIRKGELVKGGKIGEEGVRQIEEGRLNRGRVDELKYEDVGLRQGEVILGRGRGRRV